MAGFGKAKEKQEEITDEQAPAHARKNPFAALEEELQNMNNQTGHTLMALVGHENTGKSAVVTAAYRLYHDDCLEKEIEPKKLWALDFDGGLLANKSAFHSEVDGIKCWEPYVYTSEDRTAIDYQETHNRVMKLLQYAVANSDTLWGVIVTGLDQWDSVCINNMRIFDLGLAKDGISAADNRGIGADAKRVEFQWDWAIRKTRFHQLTTLCQGLVKRGVKVFLETHLAQTQQNDDRAMGATQWRPAWEKNTGGLVFQILVFEREDLRDEDGMLTKQRFTVTYEKSKTDAALQGQRRTILVTEIGKPPVWYGLQELNDGTL
ncbi:MAG: hypothetical protein CMF74_17745 [Maricaulis sp.]|jgi:hypothetical protein|nr:hypothetical protein [Maricaulis sp.]|tara:strand:+ start:415 stop:1374 length:960 start_codon:yes stop_codon:yes gene_type:complete